MIGNPYERVGGRLVVLAAANLFIGMPALSPAWAADAGNDCCRSLQERISELETTAVHKGTRRTSVILYGHVNRALLYWDDGVANDVYAVDNAHSYTRLGIKGAHKLATLALGYHLRLSLPSASSSKISQQDDDASATPTIKRAAVSISGAFGKLTMGYTSPPMSSISEIDLSGSKVIATARAGRWNDAFLVTSSTGTTAGTWGDRYVNRDGHIGHTERDLVRYDTPQTAGFTASAAWGEDDFWGMALRFARTFGPIKTAAGIGYRVHTDSADGGSSDDCTAAQSPCRFLAGSAAAIHAPSGLNLHLAAGRQESRDNSINGDFWYAKAGLKRDILSIGATALYGEYYSSHRDTAAGQSNVDIEFWGGGMVQNLSATASEIYIGYRQYSTTDASAARYNNLHMVMSGIRVKF